ncbi:MAG: NAD(P)-dependent oxidoreductase [Pseudomonadota bacterium]
MMGRIGFIGLGDMGVPMAGRLADAGLRPLVWARRPAAADSLLPRGAERAETVDELFAASDVVILMLADGAAMDAVLDRGTTRFAGLVQGTTLIHMGTTPPAYSVGLAAEVLEAGGRYAEVPVSGSTGPAVTGDLVAMTAGDADTLRDIQPVIEPMVRASVPCGAVPKALQMKIAVNTYLCGLVGGLIEAVNFARTSDLDLSTLQSVLEAGPMNCDVMRMKLPKLLSEDYAPQGSVRQFVNNTAIMSGAGREVGAAMPIVDGLKAIAAVAAREGLQDEDMTALIKVWTGQGAE